MSAKFLFYRFDLAFTSNLSSGQSSSRFSRGGNLASRRIRILMHGLGENTNGQIGIDDRSRAAVCKHNVIGGYGVSRPRYLFVSDLLSLCFSLRLRILGTHGMGAACFSSLGFRHRSRPSSHRRHRRRLVASRRERRWFPINIIQRKRDARWRFANVPRRRSRDGQVWGS